MVSTMENNISKEERTKKMKEEIAQLEKAISAAQEGQSKSLAGHHGSSGWRRSPSIASYVRGGSTVSHNVTSVSASFASKRGRGRGRGWAPSTVGTSVHSRPNKKWTRPSTGETEKVVNTAKGASHSATSRVWRRQPSPAGSSADSSPPSSPTEATAAAPPSSVVKDGTPSVTQENTCNDGQEQSGQNQGQVPRVARRAGNHKLVMVDVNHNTNTSYGGHNKSNNKKRPLHSKNKNVGAVKRIKLPPEAHTLSFTDKTGAGLGDQELGPLPQLQDDSKRRLNGEKNTTQEPQDPAKATEPRLTDFAYREVLAPAKSRRGSARTFSTSRQQLTATTRNMGLVRVKPDVVMVSPTTRSENSRLQISAKSSPSTTTHKRHPQPVAPSRVCKVYLRGEPCRDERCPYRHDIPREMATPICSFFQKRGGQCTKGDACPFLHVKVNASAAICPMFSKYGYCEDVGCGMKHLRPTR